METAPLKKFAQFARRSLMEQVSHRMAFVRAEGSLARRENPDAVKTLEKEITAHGEETVVERVAYVWFNRFCALRFMDVNRYTRIRVVSPAEGDTQPEILAEAKMGHVDERMVPEKIGRHVFALLNGSAPSPDPQSEAYRLLLVAACNHWNKAMPFLFQRIDDYTELLLPEDLLSPHAVLSHLREVMTPEACRDVEVIGWLYQFYISEKKDEVFAALKKNKKITPENIPAATQLFTPHWIVRYLVENSLGRLWLLNRPGSRLGERMAYLVDSGQLAVGSEKRSVGSEKYSVGSEKQSVGSEKYSVGSEKQSVGSEKYSVDSGQLAGKSGGGYGGGEELSGSDCLAEGDGFDGGGVSVDSGVSEGGVVRADESGSEGGGFGSVQHRGRSGTGSRGEFSQLSFDSPGFAGGGGDPDSSGNSSPLSGGSGGREGAGASAGNQQNADFASQETGNWPLTSDYLRISSPEEIKICDPACGSGHMLTYAFDLLYAIYEEEGYDPAEIPEKILTHNLYGVEIDRRAGELAAFALTMKARGRQRRFFRKGIEPNICVLRNVRFEKGELKPYLERVGAEGFTEAIVATLYQFEEANNFGALIRPEAGLAEIRAVLEALKGKTDSMDVSLNSTHEKVLRALEQAEYLARKYHVVVANPPYMGSKGMNGRLGAWAKDNFPNSKSDLFAMFMERGLEFVPEFGYSAMVTMQSWMFLSSYESLRVKFMDQTVIESMVHMANMVMGIAFGTAATVWKIGGENSVRGAYCYIEYENLDEKNRPKEFPPKNVKNQVVKGHGFFYRASAADFKKIPGSPIAYWASIQMLKAFEYGRYLSDVASPKQGIATANNDLFLRRWHELSFQAIFFDLEDQREASLNNAKWLPYNKGGDFRKWYGNNEFVINWEDEGRYIRNFCNEKGKQRSAIRNPTYFFRPCITWTDISSSSFGIRRSGKGFLFDGSSHSAFPSISDLNLITGLLGSKTSFEFLKIINPTMHFQVGNVGSIPLSEKRIQKQRGIIEEMVEKLVDHAKKDWNAYETSWDFQTLPLLTPDCQMTTANSKQTTHSCPLPTVHYPLTTSIQSAYTTLRNHWRKLTQEMQRLEEENNRIFIDAYGLQDELTPDVPLKEITLTCNPHYRYSLSGQWSEASDQEKEEELEKRLLEDTMKEFISYAVGCMFGRYSLDMPGLVLANQGETLEDYQKKLTAHRQLTTGNLPLTTDHSPLSTDHFQPTTDNIIPLLDADWFPDDITERFLQFLRVTFGEEHYEENLQFLEKSLNVKGKRKFGIRDYFLGDFYADHLKRYKKRPIYWMFSTPKGSFNALIYMHRYRPDTLNVLLNDYLREFRAKLDARKSLLESISISADAARAEKTKAIKEIEKLNRMIAEVEEYDREILYPLAARRIEIDLDDGVKVNYPKFGAALKKVPGLSDSGS